MTGGLFLSSYYLPVVGIFVGFLCPLPIIIALLRHDFVSGLFVVFTSTFLVLVLSGPLLGMAFFFGFATLGLFMGESIKRGLSPEKTIALNTIVAVVSGVILLFGAFLLLSRNPLVDFQEELQVSFKSSLNVYRNMGVEAARLEEMENNFQNIIGFLKLTFPALFLVAMGINVLITFIFAQHFLTRLNLEVKKISPFPSWRLPDHCIWLFISGFLLYLSGYELLLPVGLNLIFVMGVVYFIQGLSIAHFFFREKQIPRFGYLLFYGLLFVFPPLVMILVIASVFDLWVDFRKVTVQEKGEVS